MRIYGGHDYYDCALGFGADPTVVMVRKNEEIDPKTVNIPRPAIDIQLFDKANSSPRSWLFQSNDLKEIRVVFCSKVYHGVEIYHKGTFHYFWQGDKLQAFIDSHKELSIKLHNRSWRDWKRKLKIEEYFEVIEAPDYLRDFMITNRYAIVLEKEVDSYHPPQCWMNPHGLKKVGFAKAIDPYTAYQELSMWVGGVLAGESPKMVKITDDKVLIENHGFDNVFSFRGPRIK